LPKNTNARIFNKLGSIKENPFHFFERLEGLSEYKLRVVDYRIIADISESELKI
jgi:mRNA-degrading endonuclease RelE of RelBE toxin-antitoxin system